jgi:hypothetical protein
MIIKCPYCGCEEYDCYDMTDDLIKKCVCYDCEAIFDVVYEPVRIEKVWRYEGEKCHDC